MPEQTEGIWILIPAYNEASKIGDVIESLKTSGYSNILVVNDGSKDKTHEKALAAGAEVLNLIINRGQGAALRTGIEFLSETHSPEIIVTFDADGQHQASDLPPFISIIRQGEADIVLGSRFLEGKSEIPFWRRIVLKLAILFTNLISRIRLTDTHNGLRSLNAKAYRSIQISHRGMEHASDIIEEISRKKLRYKEVPVSIIYSEYSRQKGQKTSNFIKLGIKILLGRIT